MSARLLSAVFLIAALAAGRPDPLAAGPAPRSGVHLRSPIARVDIVLPVLPDDPGLQRRPGVEAAAAFLREARDEALDPELRDFPLSPWRVPRELRRTVAPLHAGPRLRALRVEEMAYTGGAHELVRLSGPLWDRRERRPLALADLPEVEGARPALLRALTAALRRGKRRRGVEPDVEVGPRRSASPG